MHHVDLSERRDEIAIIGMAGRFPGARNIYKFWENLRDGVESITFFTPQALAGSGVDPEFMKDPSYVNSIGFLEKADSFDASFFGYSPREAELMDPQHRIFLECAWTAMEHSGYVLENIDGLVGVFGGVAQNTYFIHNMSVYRDLIDSGAPYVAMLGSEKDFPATRVSYKLDLRGPSINVQTACSTSGVAVHLACQSLLTGESDIALTGGARVRVPLKAGYVYIDGGIPSPDGHCRAFDEKAQGTFYGSGVGIIVLKRVADALRDGDYIHAVIKGTAINNDGAARVGFTAPSVQGQAAVIEEALAMADVDADTISYVEAHGTGTPIGDPIEVAALTKAFRKTTDRVGFCSIGSVKTNIGHLDAGAAVAGIIKTVLALQHKLIPPSLHFEQPNPQIDFENSPFYVNSELSEWRASDTPRRAGVSSFGLGGTNAHIVLEEAPKVEPSGESRPHQIFIISTKSKSSLETATSNITEHLWRDPDHNLADVAYTLQVGRRTFDQRRVLVCQNLDEAVTELTPSATGFGSKMLTGSHPVKDRSIAFMFPGQGAQYVNMTQELYQVEPTFHEQVDLCCHLLQPHLGLDLRSVLYPGGGANLDKVAEQLKQTVITQPALFTIEYSLAQLWSEWGIQPKAMVGHSIGEFAAACVAGVFSLEDALSLVAARGRLMQGLPSGSMLAILLTEKELVPLLDEALCLAVINSPSLCVVSGEKEAIEGLERQLSKKQVHCRHLHTSHAFHSKMMDPILDTFTEQVRQVKLNPPQIPFVSNVTGTWITADEAVSPSYWAKHLRQTVRFSDCLQELSIEPNWVLLEVGPGNTLSTFARQHPDITKERITLSTTRHPKEQKSDVAFILNTLGQLWLVGALVDWTGFNAHERRHRVPLPTYPFERKRYWIEAGKQLRSVASTASSAPIELHKAPPPHRTQSMQSADNSNKDAPRDNVEKSIANIWQDLLGVEPVRVHDNFFDLGGSSLVAVSLFAQLNKIFGKKLPLATLFEAPTVEQLANILREEDWTASWSSLVKIQSGDSKPPFFCIHAEGGNVVGYHYLAHHLGMDLPFYGLQAQGLSGQEIDEHPIEDMAARYIKEIRTVQPGGPYFIGGWCLGGCIAYEMAQQLQAEGEEVALLAVIQARHRNFWQYSPNATWVHRLIYRIVDRIDYEVYRLSQLEPRAKLSYIWQRIQRVVTVGRVKIEGLIRSSNAVFNTNIAQSQAYSLEAVAAAHRKSQKSYEPQPYNGRVALFRARKQPSGVNPDPILGWGKLFEGELEIHEIPGEHRTILEEPSVQVLAKQLRACLDNVQNVNE
jgi:acyl transferase domain-containing protein/thioesterase domain-containing protein